MIQTQNGVFTLFHSEDAFEAMLADSMQRLPQTAQLGLFKQHLEEFLSQAKDHPPAPGVQRYHGVFFSMTRGESQLSLNFTPLLGLLFFVELDEAAVAKYRAMIAEEDPAPGAMVDPDVVTWLNSRAFQARTASYWEELFDTFQFYAAFTYGSENRGVDRAFEITAFERIISMNAAEGLRDMLRDSFVHGMSGMPANWLNSDSRRADWPGTGREPNYSWQMRRPMRYGDDAAHAGIRGMARGVMSHMARDEGRPARDYMEGLPSQGYRTPSMSDRDQVQHAMVHGHDLPLQAGRFVINDVAPATWKFLRDRMEQVGALSAKQFQELDDVTEYIGRRHGGPYVVLIMDQALLDADNPHGCLQLKASARASASSPAGLIAHIALYGEQLA